MKYLSEFFVPYDSFLQTNILLASMSVKLNSFLFLLKLSPKFSLYHQNLCSFHSFLYLSEKKHVKNFYSNLGCLIYTDKNYMKPFVITQNKKSHNKDLSKAFSMILLLRGYCSLMMHSHKQGLHNSFL